MDLRSIPMLCTDGARLVQGPHHSLGIYTYTCHVDYIYCGLQLDTSIIKLVTIRTNHRRYRRIAGVNQSVGQLSVQYGMSIAPTSAAVT